MRLKLLIGLTVALVAAAALAGRVYAHADLVSSEPRDGAMLTAPPAKITIVFDEELGEQQSGFTVTDASGVKVGEGKLDLNDLDRKTLTGTMNASAGPGSYTIAWTAFTPDDSATEEGTITFSIGASQAQATATLAATARATVAPTRAPAAQATATPAASGPAALPRTGTGAAIGIDLRILAVAATAALLGGLLTGRLRRRI
jgi:methionine-rich copper-binding protein CopC